MKRYLLAFTLAGAALALPALVGCSADPNDQLAGPQSSGTPARSPDSLAAGENTFNHPATQPSGENDVTDPVAQKLLDQQIGTPEVIARIHGCTKITYGALGSILASRGVNVPQQADNQQPNSAGTIYRNSRAALGVANYGGRVPEALFASTSAMAKEFDIFVAASQEILTNYANATGCTGSTLIQNNQFTKEGISCLIGKPARDEHVALANNLVAQAADPATGQRIAIATLLEAAHTCE
jgi:hypothetical protein